MAVDKILILKDGSVVSFGPRDQVLNALAQPDSRRAASAGA
jgi:ABC-type protease/lipase transport system fused ATPase/permease subunit